ncbi:hypothetical protein RclHR1_13920010 [Rhizophagus clarus]|uniref:JmjC domain-containing protein n=1 Tax=Rhizophagus clarus TaxID=94130 RepID=A0A2Z6QNS2_9GLOM|nr:hypothetical protein RclHR1_13920010 [Rhizophagus clarus]
MSDQEIGSTTETQPDTVEIAAFGSSKRPQRTRKATEFYTPAPKKQRKKVGRQKDTKVVKNDKPGDKRKAVDVPVERSKKRKVAEPTGSKRKFDPESDEDEARKKMVEDADLIKVRPVPGKKHVQQGRCFLSRYCRFEKCTACLAKKSDKCRFNGIRVFGQRKELVYGPEFMSVEGPDPKSTYESGVSEDEVKNVRVLDLIAPTFMKFLQKELPHLEMAKIRKFPDRNICQLCDSCQTTIFSGYWMCCVCGKEYCLSCYEEWNGSDDSFKETGRCSHRRKHYKEQLVPIYHYAKEEIIRLFDQCNQMILDDEDSSNLDGEELPDDDGAESSEATRPIESSRAVVRRRKPRTSRAKAAAAIDVVDSTMSVLNKDNGISTSPQDCHDRTPQLHDEHKKIEYAASEMTEETFRDLWKRGYPFVIRGAGKLEKEIWKPNYFIEHYGKIDCTVIDVKENVEYKMDVETFFKGFEDINSRFVNKSGICPCLKLKDWPPADDFAEMFPEHYKDFYNSLSFKEYTSRSGILNLAHRLPLEFNRPDLGPKMYNAYGSEDNMGGKGTTNLHLDMTDAVNMMAYAPNVESRLEEERDKPAAAVWDLYHPADLPRVRRFLRKIAKELGLSINHPIHDQCFYLDKELRSRLASEEGVTGWRVFQNPGDVVFVPAGCAHQVCNYTSCVKAAVDFVSPEGVARSYVVNQQFRKLRHGHKRKTDILQLPNILYHAWITSWDESND